jgi:hypothetical protein
MTDQEEVIANELAIMAYQEAKEGTPEKGVAWVNWAVQDMKRTRLSIAECQAYILQKFELRLHKNTLQRAVQSGRLPGHKWPIKPGSGLKRWVVTEYDLCWWVLSALKEVDPQQLADKHYSFDDVVKASLKLQQEGGQAK